MFIDSILKFIILDFLGVIIFIAIVYYLIGTLVKRYKQEMFIK